VASRQNEYRLLLPWFDQQRAIRLLAGAKPTPQAAEQATERWLRAAGKLRARHMAAFSTATQPLPAALAGLANEFAGASGFAGLPDFQGADLRLVELASLLTFQAKISVDGSGELFPVPYDGSLESVFRICLPANARMDPVQVQTAGASARIASDNPNLRFGGFQLSGSTLVATFGFRPPWVQVCEYRGRLFVRNGYHRCWALLNAGATHAIALTLKVATLGELGAAEDGYVSEAHLLSAAPPMLYDFEDPDFYATFSEPASRRVINLTATEFMELPTQ
jgi:hypothetical protein